MAVLSSCLTPIDDTHIIQVKDDTGPIITILSPEDGSYYAKTMIVEGIVSDATESLGKGGEVNSLFYEILGTTIQGEISFESDGSFRFQFTTTDLPDTITVKITAHDWNGNTSERSLTFKSAGNDIPSFTATTDNHKITLNWDDVPMAQSYTIYYTTNGTFPSEYFGKRFDNAESPLVFSGLKNGNLHVFLLQAHSPEGYEDNWSDYQNAIPLSKNTLAPTITSYYGKLLVEWENIPKTNEFEVWRAENKDGPFLNIYGTVSGYSIEDSEVEYGKQYFYKVRPSLAGSIESGANAGEMSPFPQQGNEILGTYNATITDPRDVAVSGGYAFIADYYNDIRILDISDPEYPWEVGSYDLPGYATNVVASGSYLYTIDGTGDLRVVDISNPKSPVTAGTFDQLISSGSVEVSGNYVYVAAYTNGLRIIDISDLSNIVEKGYYLTPSDALKVAVKGNYAYVVTATNGVRVIDVSNPASPSEVGYYDTVTNARDVVISGNYAYVAAVNNGLRVLDITTPSNPVQVGFCITSSNASEVDVIGNYVYVDCFSSVVLVIDVSDRSNPLEVWSYGFNYSIQLDAEGDFLYVVERWTTFHIVDVHQVGNPLETVSCSTNKIMDVATSGNYAYVADGNAGLRVIDIDSNSTSFMQIVGTRDTYNALGVTVSGNYAYIADDVEGLKIIDIDPKGQTYLQILGSCVTDNALRVAVGGDYAYIADSSGGLKVLDISDPTKPFMIASVDTNDEALDVVVHGDYVYVADYFESFLVIDVSDPRQPSVVGTVNPADPQGFDVYAYGVTIKGNYAFVAGDYGGLKIIDRDRTNPDFPDVVGTCVFSGDAQEVAVSGNYAYVAGSWGGFFVIDITDPANPIELSSYDTTNDAYSVAVSGNYAYIGTRGAIDSDLVRVELWRE